MNRQKNPGYDPEELLTLIKKTFGEKYEGEYAVIKVGKKPDSCLYDLYANPVSTPSLVYNPYVHDGFKFEVVSDRQEQAIFDTPEDSNDLLLAINRPEFRTNRVYRKTGQVTAAVNGNVIALKIQDGFPSPEEINGAFKTLKARARYVTIGEGGVTQVKTEGRPKTSPTAVQEEKLMARLRARFSRTSQQA
jgi:hypothetical protein